MRYFKNIISFTLVIYILSIFILFNRSYATELDNKAKCHNHPAMSEVIETVDDILANLESNKKTIQANPKEVYKIINRLLVPKADFDVMSQLVLTRNWKKLNTKQKKDFTKEFSRLMIRTYGVAFESYDGETVTYECPVRKLRSTGSRKRAEIATTIHSMNRPDNIVKFRILETDKGCESWQVNYDSCNKLAKNKAEDCKANTDQCKPKCVSCDNCNINDSLKKKVSYCKKIAKECKSIKTKYKKLKSSSNSKELAELDKNYDICKENYDSCKGEVSVCKENCGSCDQCEQSNQISCNKSNSVWLVYDLIIDNVSIINSYRQIFKDKFKKQTNPDKIIADMHKKNCKDKAFCV